ncbi:DUF833 domain-containing protein [Histoplasma capsulatum]|uniref:DUF833 domain-containing protein n=1 Tax=Ajellomyces capsulatus TaxID=5037 RepID=A0A8A1MPN7_AJECA|nr:predicted protein [Histoplasma mississippiense (nom. inval.)]EDN05030.1 predicted protein [Histoplasma mississippiense (nom. inval.)]QSS66583.1 DUF833 domain-containing protein [Histoplasma capsulatum]
MCIALISTAHPCYPLILIDNRDEFLHRPTAPAYWWPGDKSHVLGSRDLAREVHGTWLGVTKQGRIAVLTNYREDTDKPVVGVRSRGSIVNSFLELPPDSTVTAKEYAEDLISGGDAQLAGGFSLVCGNVRGPLAVVSNRVSAADGIEWIANEKGQTVGLSNTVFGDRSWRKIVDGERLLKEAIDASVKLGECEDALVQRLLELLSRDTLPRLREGGNLETYINLLRESIFIPVIGDDAEIEHTVDEVCASKLQGKVDVVANGPTDHHEYMRGLYGTQTQTVVLVHESGRVKYFERTLYNDQAEQIKIGEGDRTFEFTVE